MMWALVVLVWAFNSDTPDQLEMGEFSSQQGCLDTVSGMKAATPGADVDYFCLDTRFYRPEPNADLQ